MTLRLRKFSMSDIQFEATEDRSKGPVMVCLGRRDTGKTFLVRDILSYRTDIPFGVVISGTEEGNGFYGQLMPPQLIHTEYSSRIIEKILQRQKGVLGVVNREKAHYGAIRTDPRCFIIMDDCLYDDKWSRDKLMRCLFMNGRHWRIMLIITMQYPLGVPPILRSQIDYVFILRDNYISNRERIYKNYAGMFPTFEAFCTVMDQCTENYECLVIKNNSQSNKLTDQVFYYLADDHEPFRLCAEQFWGARQVDEDEYDPMQHRRKPNATPIHVRRMPAGR